MIYYDHDNPPSDIKDKIVVIPTRKHPSKPYSTNYLTTLRSQCSLNTQRKKKMKWTFKLPSISLVSVNDETPSMVEDIESNNLNSSCNNSTNNTDTNNVVNGNGMMMGSPSTTLSQQVNVDEPSNYGFDILYC